MDSSHATPAENLMAREAKFKAREREAKAFIMGNVTRSQMGKTYTANMTFNFDNATIVNPYTRKEDNGCTSERLGVILNGQPTTARLSANPS